MALINACLMLLGAIFLGAVGLGFIFSRPRVFTVIVGLLLIGASWIFPPPPCFVCSGVRGRRASAKI